MGGRVGYLIKFINYIIYFKYVVNIWMGWDGFDGFGISWPKLNPTHYQKKFCNTTQPTKKDWIFEYSQPAKKGVGYKSTK